MITEVEKYVVVGLLRDLDLFYSRAQKEGIMQFLSKERKGGALPETVEKLWEVRKILSKQEGIALQKEEDLWSAQELIEAVQFVLQKEQERIHLQEERRFFLFEESRLTPLGNISLEDLRKVEEISKRKIQFFSRRAGGRREVPAAMIFLQEVEGQEYYCTIEKDSQGYTGFVEVRMEHSLQEVKKRLQEVEDALSRNKIELQDMARHGKQFHHALLEGMNHHHLEMAKHTAAFPMGEEGGIFSVEAWIPKTQVSRIQEIIGLLPVYMEPILTEEEDRIPTVLENTGFNRVGEDLTRVYDIPSKNDKDPSGWVFWSFALFFAMITSDAGYGMLYLLFALFLRWKKGPFRGVRKRFYTLCVVLSCCVIGWGVMTASFFGLQLSQDNFLRKISPLQKVVEIKASYHLQHQDQVYKDICVSSPLVEKATTGKELLLYAKQPGQIVSKVTSDFSDSILLETSLLVGVIHIILSLLRYMRRNLAHIGWILFLLGGYLYFPLLLKTVSMANFLWGIPVDQAAIWGKQLLYVGIGLALILAIWQRGLEGMKELMNMVQVFGDVLSYVRLYALALASMIMAGTFNSMGESVGFIGGFLIILLGHATTIGLGIMSGAIHGLRLNFLEWYHYSFEGGGSDFRPLKIIRSQEE